MLRHLILFSLNFRPIVLLAAVILLIGGAVSMRDAPWDVFPEFAPPQVVVQTEARGLSTIDVERLVTIPVESAINGVSRIKTLRSSSVPGLSIVTAIFDEGTDILAARQLVAERLTQISGELPEGTGPPRMTPIAASTSRLLMIGLTSDKVSPMELRTLADWTFKRRLQAVAGVANVEVFGGEVKQYQILVKPKKLQKHRIALDQVIIAGRKATEFGGGGFLETANQRIPVQQRTQIETVEDLAAVPVVIENGVAVKLGQVADVVVAPANMVGGATVNGKPGILLIVHKQPDFNTLSVTENVEGAVEELRDSLPQGVVLHTGLFRQATFIERAIGNLGWAILIGCVLVAVVLIAFLNDWRTVVITLTAIPLSLLGAIVILRAFGFSLNAMTLGGLAIALGEVVDDAIVDVENVLHRLRENWQLPEPKPAFQVVLNASLEVRSAVVYASFIVVFVFVPVFFLQGLAGTIFRPLGYAYVAAIVTSLVVALTVTPGLCLLFFRKAKIAAGTDVAQEALLVRGLKWLYRRALPSVLHRPKRTLAVAGLLLVGSIAVLPFFGGEFLPEFRESNFVIHMAGKPDSSLPESVRVGGRLTQQLQTAPGVVNISQQIGRAELAEDTWGVNISEVWISIDENADHDESIADIRKKLDRVPGYVFQVKQFLRERIDEVLTGTTANIVVAVAGSELSVLRTQAEKIAKSISHVPGVADLKVEQQVEVPQLEILLRPKDAANYGLSVGDLHQTIQTLLQGAQVGQVYEQDRIFNVVVRSNPQVRMYPKMIGRLLIDTPTGDSIPLSAVASVCLVDAPNQINREKASRRILVTCNAEGRDVSSVVGDIRSRLQATVFPLPPGYHLEYSGQYEARAAAQQRLLLLGALAVCAIFLLLYVDFRSFRLTLLVMLSLPFALVGGIIAVLLSGGDISLGTLVGFVTVFGIAVRNGILLIGRYQHLQTEENVAFDSELILRGAAERMTPILMTASTTALALVPLVIRGNLPGHEIEHPMAVVIIGGLVSSTILTLALLPVLYRWFGQVKIG